MGNLKPGATYIYERADGVTYAREVGADPDTRTPIGWDYDPVNGHRINDFWRGVIEEAQTNPALQKALDRVIMLYKLSKERYE
jgi:hypothetical protein